MTPALQPAGLRVLPMLLRGVPLELRRWLAQAGAAQLGFCALVIAVGGGLFGASVGSWRSEAQALYTALKLPLILLLTALGNGLLNGLLAPLLGVNLPFRQSLLAVLLSFTVVAAILGSFAPLIAFFLWNLPALAEGVAVGRASFQLLQVLAVAAIAFAGVEANVRLFQLLRELAGSRAPAQRLLVAWLAANLLLGAQLTWIARPFFGQPDLPVEFLRENALDGNFFEAVAYNAGQILRRIFSGFD